MNAPRPVLTMPRAPEDDLSVPPRLKVFVLTREALTEIGHGRKRIRWPHDAIVLKDLSDLVSGKEARWLVYSGTFPCLQRGQPAPACYPALEPIA